MKASIELTVAPFFFLLFFKLISCLQTHTFLCPENEKQALLTLKHSLNDSYINALSSWNAKTDCCEWRGVVCNNLTGHVHQLRLQGNSLIGKLDPALLNLKHMRYLDLSWNHLQGTFPPFLGSFARLEYLDLVWSGFNGIIPNSFGNLSNLQTFNVLPSFDFPGFDNLEWLSKLSRLEYLGMSHVQLGKASNWAQVINTLPSLKNLTLVSCSLYFDISFNGGDVSKSLIFLDLSDNNFNFSVIPSWIFQISSLVVLDLSRNHFNGLIPSIANTTKLQYLDLGQNQLIGFIPSIANITKLQHLDLSINELASTIPSWLYLCKDIKFLSFNNNAFYGAISDDISNLTSLETLEVFGNKLSGNIPRGIGNLYKMKTLWLDDNYFQGLIPDSVGNMLGLDYLGLSNNQLLGGIPASLGNLSSVTNIGLRDNELSGNLPETLGQLVSLEWFDISNNMLEGAVTESHFANLTKLERFSASQNNLTLNVSSNWIPPFELERLALGSWNLGEGNQVPSWILSQNSISELDLSNTGIIGTIPGKFWNLTFLDLSNNQIHGNISGIRVGRLYLSSNQFNGPLPRLSAVSELDLSSNSFTEDISQFLCDETFQSSQIKILHLGGNQLSGKLPDCWEKWSSLNVLHLGNNNISGSIPNSLALLEALRSLNLNGNKLSGRIPFSLLNCTELLKIDLSHNNLEGNLPREMGTMLAKLRFLFLRSNKLAGEIFPDICHLSSLQILDLSDNMFVGIIPECVGNFSAMTTKPSLEKMYDPLSYGNLHESASINTKGTEIQYDVTLSLVTLIDLSKNNFSGSIPKELTRLVELRSLNLSGNHFRGPIPNNFGDMKQLESLDLSRNSLSGGIPESFKSMFFLNFLNLSYNNLTGRIPESTQIRGLDPSSFAGNNLCGLPLTDSCGSIPNPNPTPKVTTTVKEGKPNIQWLYVFTSLGFAMGLSSFCSALLNKSWRETYFEFLEDIWDWIYVHCCIAWRKVKAK